MEENKIDWHAMISFSNVGEIIVIFYPTFNDDGVGLFVHEALFLAVDGDSLGGGGQEAAHE